MRWLQNRTAPSIDDVASLVHRNVLERRDFGRALEAAGLVPGARGWRVAVQRLLMGAGLGLMLAGVVCIVAYNWAGMRPGARLALAQAGLLAVLGLALWRGIETPAGRWLLTAAALLVGPLLALFGQTYQTGADTWELFRGWALLSLPWVLASRRASAWLAWLAIVETGFALYCVALDRWVWPWPGVPAWLFASAFNLGALVAWEAAGRRWAWLGGRAGPRAIAACLLAVLTGATAIAVLANGTGLDVSSLVLAPLAWALVIAAGYLAYRVRAVEIGMLTLGWLSLTLVLFAWLLRFAWSFGSPTLALLLGAALLVGASAGGRYWLTKAAADRRP
ncbi:MAG: DUF2157 domain-containing protein [Burkholderiaceae bacterium]